MSLTEALVPTVVFVLPCFEGQHFFFGSTIMSSVFHLITD